MGRPSQPLLSRERIRDAALDLIDAHGLENLSMRLLADELGVRAASLYGHYRTKESVLGAIADKIMESVDVSGFADNDWRSGLLTWARSYRAALAAHPNTVPLLAAGPVDRDPSLRRADAVHGALVRAGWPPRYATMVGASVKYLVVGAAAASFAQGFVDDIQVYLDRYPNFAHAHRLREHAEQIDRDSFEFALGALISGLAAAYGTASLDPDPSSRKRA